MVAVSKQKVVASIEFSSAKGNFEREKEVEDTMLDLLKPFTAMRCILPQLRQLGVTLRTKMSKKNLFMKSFPRLSPMREEIRLGNDTKSKKGIIGSQPTGNHNAFIHYPKEPIVKFVRRQKQHEPGVE